MSHFVLKCRHGIMIMECEWVTASRDPQIGACPPSCGERPELTEDEIEDRRIHAMNALQEQHVKRLEKDHDPYAGM